MHANAAAARAAQTPASCVCLPARACARDGRDTIGPSPGPCSPRLLGCPTRPDSPPARARPWLLPPAARAALAPRGPLLPSLAQVLRRRAHRLQGRRQRTRGAAALRMTCPCPLAPLALCPVAVLAPTPCAHTTCFVRPLPRHPRAPLAPPHTHACQHTNTHTYSKLAHKDRTSPVSRARASCGR